MKQYLMVFDTKEFYEEECPLRDINVDAPSPDSDTGGYVINRKLLNSVLSMQRGQNRHSRRCH
jgi:hypothetical protein